MSLRNDWSGSPFPLGDPPRPVLRSEGYFPLVERSIRIMELLRI